MIYGADTRADQPTVTTGPVAPVDRTGYWFPMLVFGVLIIAAPLVYRPAGPSDADFDIWNPAVNVATHIPGLTFAPLQQFGTCDSGLGDPLSVALYWFCVVMFGPLITMLWYHRRARQDGSAPQTGWYLLYSCTSLALYVVLFPVIEFISLHLPDQNEPSPGTMRFLEIITTAGFVAGLAIAGAAAWPCRLRRHMSSRRWTVSWLGMLLAIAAAAAIEFLAYVQPRDSYGSLLIIGVGLLALSLVERSRVCAAVAILFTAAALLVNLVGMHSLITWLGGSVGTWSESSTALGDVALPAAILIVGGLIGIAGSVAARYRTV